MTLRTAAFSVGVGLLTSGHHRRPAATGRRHRRYNILLTSWRIHAALGDLFLLVLDSSFSLWSLTFFLSWTPVSSSLSRSGSLMPKAKHIRVKRQNTKKDHTSSYFGSLVFVSPCGIDLRSLSGLVSLFSRRTIWVSSASNIHALSSPSTLLQLCTRGRSSIHTPSGCSPLSFPLQSSPHEDLGGVSSVTQADCTSRLR